ncbi:hypothetical protein ABMA28_010176 [Loxostege sticticalis]|uniref:FP protein C-terminal domain-containing protein n=1 Tax=Loxostege sticticalis TaxID=481309 RepID=A0ABD0SAI1_LOXSC
MQRTPPSSPRKGNSDDTENQMSYVTNRPNKRLAPSSSPQSQEDFPMPATQRDVREIVTDIVQTQMNSFMSQISETISRAINKEISSLKEEIEGVRNSMDFINEKFEDMTRDHVIMKKDNRINAMEQNARSNNVEVQCVPENKNENINISLNSDLFLSETTCRLAYIMQIAKTVGCSLAEENLLHCTRVAKIDKSSTRPRSIIAQLSSSKLRDNLLAAAITFNKQNKNDKRKKTIYLMEHLSPTNKSLHAAARTRSRELGYKHVWVRNGRIFMRKTDESAFILVKDKEFLDKLQ